MFYAQYIKACDFAGEKPTAILEELGIPTGNLGNWKNRGTTPKGDIVIKIAARLNVPPDFLTGDDDMISHEEKDKKQETINRIAKKFEGLTDEEANKAEEYIEFIVAQRKNNPAP